MKNKPDPIALEDWQYPPWLWTLLQPKSSEGASADEDGDLYGELCGFDDPPEGSYLELCILISVDSKIEKAAASGGEAASERGEEQYVQGEEDSDL